MRKIALGTQAVLAAALVCWSGGAFEHGLESRQDAGQQSMAAKIVNALQGAGPVDGEYSQTTDQHAEISPLQSAQPLFAEASSQEADALQGTGSLLGVGPLQGMGPFLGVGPFQGAAPLIAVPPIFTLPQLTAGQTPLLLAALPPGAGNAPRLSGNLPTMTLGAAPASMVLPSMPQAQTAGPAPSTPDYGPTPEASPVTTPDTPWAPTPPYFTVPSVNTSACARAGSCT